MKNWIIRKLAHLKAWWLSREYRRDHKQFRKGYAWVMCSRYVDHLDVGDIQGQVSRRIRDWDKKHPYGPPNGFNEGAVMALRKIREIDRHLAAATTGAQDDKAGDWCTAVTAATDAVNGFSRSMARLYSRGMAPKAATPRPSKDRKPHRCRDVQIRKGASRNQPCPCGSGLKFKRCCIDKKGGLHDVAA